MDVIGNIFTFKKKTLVKREIKDSYIYQVITKQLYPNEKSSVYIFYQKLLNKAVVHIGVDDLFNIKALMAIVSCVIILLVTRTSMVYQTKELIDSASNKSSLLFATETKVANKAEDEETKRQNERKIFEYLKERYNYEQLKKNEIDAVARISIDIEQSNIKSKDESTEDLARRQYKKLIDYYELQRVDYFLISLMVTFTFFVPEMFLYIRSYLMKFLIYNEYLQLEVTAIMVGKLEPIKVEEILNVMSENSTYFKRYIDEIKFNYFDVKNGHSKAFEAVIQKISSKELKYLLKSLQQAAESDIKITIENLENQRKSNKEYRSIVEQNNLKKKELLAILVILIVLAAVCTYSFGAFQGLINNFSI